MNNLTLRPVKVETINNVTNVEGHNVTVIVQAARSAFAAGAEEMARMFEEAYLSRDTRKMLDLIAATKTKSFYGNN